MAVTNVSPQGPPRSHNWDWTAEGTKISEQQKVSKTTDEMARFMDDLTLSSSSESSNDLSYSSSSSSSISSSSTSWSRSRSRSRSHAKRICSRRSRGYSRSYSRSHSRSHNCRYWKRDHLRYYGRCPIYQSWSRSSVRTYYHRSYSRSKSRSRRILWIWKNSMS